MNPKKAYRALRQAALEYPDAYRETPWGEEVIKVRRKIFVFVGKRDGGLTVTTKLPESRYAALGLEFTSPTGYGLGKSGWVTSTFRSDDDVPVDLLLEWIDESYRAVAPKRLVKTLGATPAASPTAPQAQLEGSVLLVGEDTARLERAADALTAHGLTVDQTDYEGAFRISGVRDLVVFDLNRRFHDGLAQATLLAEEGAFPGPVVFTGVASRKRANLVKAAIPGSPSYKHAPGEPAMVAALLLQLQG